MNIMNIFVLARDPFLAAQYQCDKHVSKMLLEATQLLCNAFPDGNVPYKRTHYNHPCSKWAREARVNFFWLRRHAWALAAEYRYRFGRMHASEAVLFWLDHKGIPPVFGTAQEEHAKKLRFVQAMPDRYRGSNVVAAYRRYYAAEKSRFAKWERGRKRKEPRWWRRYLKEAKEV